MLNLGVKAEKQLQNENHNEDWALGSHPRDKWSRDSLDNDIIFNLTILSLKRVLNYLWCQAQRRFSQLSR